MIGYITSRLNGYVVIRGILFQPYTGNSFFCGRPHKNEILSVYSVKKPSMSEARRILRLDALKNN